MTCFESIWLYGFCYLLNDLTSPPQLTPAHIEIDKQFFIYSHTYRVHSTIVVSQLPKNILFINKIYFFSGTSKSLSFKFCFFQEVFIVIMISCLFNHLKGYVRNFEPPYKLWDRFSLKFYHKLIIFLIFPCLLTKLEHYLFKKFLRKLFN